MWLRFCRPIGRVQERKGAWGEERKTAREREREREREVRVGFYGVGRRGIGGLYIIRSTFDSVL